MNKDLNKRAINTLLAVTGLTKKELAHRMGISEVYARQVLNGFNPVSVNFRRMFLDVVDKELFGERGVKKNGRK